MFTNNLILALRNFWKHKIFSLINIAGLAIGISASLVIYLIVQYEFSFEEFHPDGERIFRVVSRIEPSGFTFHNSGVPVPTAQAARTEISGIEVLTHFFLANEPKVAVTIPGNQSPAVFKKVKNIIYADEEYFSVFQYDWLAGSPLSALKNPFQVVLSESRAKTYFANLSYQDILGKTIIYDDSLIVTVSGIVKDINEITDFTFKEFISRSTPEHTGLKSQWSWEEWGNINSNSQMYVKLIPGSGVPEIETQLASMRELHRDKKENPKKDEIVHSLQPLKDIHFSPNYGGYNNRQAKKSILISLLAVAAFLLLLGCINFINLTTAQSALRAKEIGIRKTMGSGKSQLVVQFLSETFAFTLLATIVSVALTPVLLNVFKDFIPPDISFKSINQLHVWLFLIGLMILVSLISGIYPALILTGYKPVTVLKNQAYSGTSQSRRVWLRKTLTVSQFVITQVLLIGTLAFIKQIHYSLTKDLGYKKDAIVFLNTYRDYYSTVKDERRMVLVEKLKSIPEIEQVVLAGGPPAYNSTSMTSMKYKDGDREVETLVELKYADTDYFTIYGMKLLSGSHAQKSDTTKEFVINETYAKVLGFQNPVDAIGKLIESNEKMIPISGVIADFHTKSTHEPIKPLVFSSAASNSYTLHLALKPGGDDAGLWKRALDKTKKVYAEIYPGDEFEYKFFDESIAAFYTNEQNMIRLLKWATGLCIFISCLGLLGLVIYTTTQRTKEIGVRKVLGATVTQILALLSVDFIQLVVIAFLIATPVAWYGINKWLASFEYRAQIGLLLFVTVGLSALAIALITISFQAIKAALANPTKSLRSE